MSKKWINTKDGLPDKNGYYWVYYADDTYMCNRYGVEMFEHTAYNVPTMRWNQPDCDIEKWMPITEVSMNA